jgi:predicted membrane channel-forming protein YqfA (hemolysin III family)
MSRRGRDRRVRERAARGRSVSPADERFIDALRQFQLASAGVMLVGFTVATIVCVGEFKQLWIMAAGGVVFALGLALYGVAPRLARWWISRR